MVRQLTKREAENIAANMRMRRETDWVTVKEASDGWKVTYQVTIGILFGATFRGEVSERV